LKNSFPSKKLRIGYTLGDLAGIGPEIFTKFQRLYQDHHEFDIVLVDDPQEVANYSQRIPLGQASALAGEHALHSLERAHELLSNHEIDYLITGPVAKESLWLAGIDCSGQTELLAQINKLNRNQIEMFFTYKNFRTVLATRHIKLQEVSDNYQKRFRTVLENSSKALEQIFAIDQAKIAVTGLNPHAGEKGLLGKEEEDFIKPEIENFNNKTQHQVSGPFPADAVLGQAAQRVLQGQNPDYDLYVCAYHDQVLPLIKGIAGFNAINLTIGLPYLRLSVDHGTAFDIATQHIASPQALIACTEYCFELAKTAKLSSFLRK